jgi:trk system potassium uptake protein TrkH
MSKWNSKNQPAGHKRFSLRRLTSPQIIILSFFSIIVVGAFLLMLPISLASNQFNNPYTAFFTATSATCVTGLTLVDTELYYSAFGQAVILLLIQIGGLGFMSLAMLFNLLLKRRVSPKERVIFVQSMNLFSSEKMFPFIKSMLTFTFSFEGAGALLLSLRFVPKFGVGEGIAKSVFHSVSAFCNAGFDILGKSNPRPF